jgi:ParB family transcriptional regulator, chromosome partitioning protein
MADRKPALGKGLSALIPDAPESSAPPRAPFEVDLDLLAPNDYQPRAHVNDERLQELARSIKSNGVIQPIVVRAVNTPGERHATVRYQIIAGERRWRAAQLAGLMRVPVVVKELGGDEKKQRLEMALIENIQRENLNPMEEAHAYQRLADEFGLKQDEIALQVGKDRSSVANTLRLLRLPEEVQAEVAVGHLSMGHARAIVSLSSDADQRRVARDVLSRSLSVRETEAIVKKTGDREAPAKPASTAPRVNDVHTRAAEEQLRLSLGTAVNIRRRGKGGRVEIAFADEDELQRIYEYLTDLRRTKN